MPTKKPTPAKKAAHAVGMPQFDAVVDAQGMRDQLRTLKWPHYVYALCDQDGAGFYVGVGQGPRVFAHLAEAKAGGKSLKCRLIRHFGDRLRFALVFCTDWRPYALALEAYLIREFRGNLTNVENGSPRLMAGWFDPRDESLHSLRLLQAAMDKFEALRQMCDADLERIDSVIAKARAA